MNIVIINVLIFFKILNFFFDIKTNISKNHNKKTINNKKTIILVNFIYILT